MKNKYLNKISEFTSISDRALATASLLFPLAFGAEFILSRLQHQEISGQSVFGFWYILIAFRFPALYLISLSLAAIIIMFSGLGQFFDSNFSSHLGSTASFGLILLAVIQLIILKWQEKSASH